jgi:MoxR-like ATPase
LYHWIGYPTVSEEVDIVRVQAPDVTEALTRKVVDAVHRLRDLDLAKPPGVAETIDWVEALGAIGADNLDGETAIDTLGSVIKDRDDLEFVSSGIDRVVPDA